MTRWTWRVLLASVTKRTCLMVIKLAQPVAEQATSTSHHFPDSRRHSIEGRDIRVRGMVCRACREDVVYSMDANNARL
jgi:hypothetical protein